MAVSYTHLDVYKRQTPQPGSNLAFACPLFDGIAPGEYFYFTHSYIAPTGSHTVAELSLIHI